MELALPKQPSNKLPRRPRRSIKTFGVIQGWHSNMDHRGPSDQIFLQILKIPRMISRWKGNILKKWLEICKAKGNHTNMKQQKSASTTWPESSRNNVTCLFSKWMPKSPRDPSNAHGCRNRSHCSQDLNSNIFEVWKVKIRHVNQVKQRNSETMCTYIIYIYALCYIFSAGLGKWMTRWAELSVWPRWRWRGDLESPWQPSPHRNSKKNQLDLEFKQKTKETKIKSQHRDTKSFLQRSSRNSV